MRIVHTDERARRLQEERERRLHDEMHEIFAFLVKELGYSPPFQMPARDDDSLILAYRNAEARRQIEVSGRPDEYRTHCEIRRLVEGEPGAYGPHSIGEWELRLLRDGAQADVLFERRPAFERTARTLREHADILRGTAWIDRAELERAQDHEFFGKYGEEPPPRDTPSRLDVARRLAEPLVTEHGFTLELDSDALSPHEAEMWLTLRYRRGDTVVEIVNGDIRIATEWSVRLNGETVARDWPDFERGLRDALAEVVRRIS